MINLQKLSQTNPNMVAALRQNSTVRIETMRSYRLSFWAHWALLAELFLPRRYRWFVTPNQYNRGSMINQKIVDETGVIAARKCANGMFSGLTSPNKIWFRFGIHGMEENSVGPEREWLASCEEVVARVLSESNFYTSLGIKYLDNAVFGSAAIICYEDKEDVVRFVNPCLGEFFFAASNRLVIDTLAREYTYTVRQVVQEFGLENTSVSTQTAYRTGGGSLDLEVVIGHMIEPNTELYFQGQNLGLPVPKIFPWRETYWEQSSSTGQNSVVNILKLAGFREKPFAGARWDVTSNDPYGRSPGMDALPANIQLQIEQRRKAEAIEKMVRPPMVGSVSMRNEPASILPGDITYVADPAAAGFKPAFQVEPRISEMVEDIKEVQARINDVFFIDLFMMISQLDTVRTATEIDARREEKLIQLGPVIERDENEVLSPLLMRVFAICQRRGLFPPMPPTLQSKVINIRYISMLADAQRAAETSAIERLLGLAGNLVGVVPDVMDNLKVDDIIEKYSDLLNVPPNLIRAMKEVLQIRAARSQGQQQAAALQTGQAAATAAQTLSQTDVGGGKNALQLMTGGASLG